MGQEDDEVQASISYDARRTQEVKRGSISSAPPCYITVTAITPWFIREAG